MIEGTRNTYSWPPAANTPRPARPDILVAIADDPSHVHPSLAAAALDHPAAGAVRVDDGTEYQSVLGMGSSLEHSTCYNLNLLPPDQRERVMESLVHPTRGIGMNLIRLCIGTSDFAPGPFYTYDEMPAAAPAHVAFRNPDGHLVLVAANPDSLARALVLEWKGRTFSAIPAATSGATFRWRP